MRLRDIAELFVLAALWGGSFLFMRVAVPEIGPVALAALRVAGATLLLLPLLAANGLVPALRRHWPAIALVGLCNSAFPFLCFAYAALSINVGVSAVINSATPLFAAAIAWAWLGDRMTAMRTAGLAIGFAGVVFVATSKAGFSAAGSARAGAACLVATLSYGIAPNLTKRHLGGVPPLAIAAGSQLAATVFLAIPALWTWPTTAPSPRAWWATAALAFACTGIAYVLYFRLIANAGPANAVAVTYLVPIFALLWGGLFLAEPITWTLIGGCAVIFFGTALATGVIGRGLATVKTTPAMPEAQRRRRS